MGVGRVSPAGTRTTWERGLRIYIAGPYSADSPDVVVANVNRAIDAGIQVFRLGHSPYVPHLTDLVDQRARQVGEDIQWLDFIRWDMPWLEECDAVLYLAPSSGADLELAEAERLGKIVYRSIEEIPDASFHKDSLPSIDVKAAWDREYSELQTIPGSMRVTPAKALQTFSDMLSFDGMRRALDVGCGNGRNAIYLAGKGMLVDAIDKSDSALAIATKRVMSSAANERIRLHHADVTQRLPFDGESFDLVLDAYVFCHLLTAREQGQFVDEVARVAKKGAYLITLLFPPGDDYYRRLVINRTLQITDPINGIAKQLYTRDRAVAQFSRKFSPVLSLQIQFPDTVNGFEYQRTVLGIAFTKV